MKIDEIISIDIKENDDSKPVMALDFSKLNSISTCPMYGITRHILNKNFHIN